jgi:hypothetical protein
VAKLQQEHDKLPAMHESLLLRAGNSKHTHGIESQSIVQLINFMMQDVPSADTVTLLWNLNFHHHASESPPLNQLNTIHKFMPNPLKCIKQYKENILMQRYDFHVTI